MIVSPWYLPLHDLTCFFTALAFIKFTGSDISQFAVSAGNSGSTPIYVARSSSKVIGWIQKTSNSYCFYISKTACSSSFDYLGVADIDTINYKWVTTKFGDKVPNTVTVDGRSFGRITVNNRTYVGAIVNSVALLYYNAELEAWKSAFAYDILTLTSWPTTTPGRKWIF